MLIKTTKAKNTILPTSVQSNLERGHIAKLSPLVAEDAFICHVCYSNI